jgi:coenzyme F420 hydrogenase subunit beta
MTMAPEKLQWKHLFDEVVTSGLCTGCAGCVIACPHDVLGYRDHDGTRGSGGVPRDSYKPFHLEEDLGLANCGHGERGCTSCTRACPRFRAWETEADEFLFGRPRLAVEVEGVSKDILLTRAADPHVHELGQDGGLVSAILI